MFSAWIWISFDKKSKFLSLLYIFNFKKCVIRKIVQFVSTVSSFFFLIIIFHLNSIILLLLKMNKKQFLFHSWKIRAEGRIPLSFKNTVAVLAASFILHSWMKSYKRVMCPIQKIFRGKFFLHGDYGVRICP